MALSNLISDRIEVYGGIDLKNNFQKFFGSALGISILLHCLVIFSALAYTWLSVEDTRKVPHMRIRSLTDLAPPPSTSQEVQEAIPLEQAAPPADIAKPNFGVPVAVPDAVAPQAVMPDLNNLPTTGVSAGTGTVAGIEGGRGTEPVIVKETKEAEPSIDDFIEVSDEPKPVVNIQSLVEYPETAKRAGLEGKVTASALIGKDGRVEKVEIQKSDYKLFEEAAKTALLKARFTPARQNGQPVRIWFTQVIVFKLNTK